MKPLGHVVACRITAENPDAGFKPTSGKVEDIFFRNNPAVSNPFCSFPINESINLGEKSWRHLFALHLLSNFLNLIPFLSFGYYCCNAQVWGYFSIHSSGGVHEFSDSQFGHLFAFSRTSRDDARKHMVTALKDLEIHGDIR
jgi:acetyl-CoA carboxylase/biotin carboxylase 1